MKEFIIYLHELIEETHDDEELLKILIYEINKKYEKSSWHPVRNSVYYN